MCCAITTKPDYGNILTYVTMIAVATSGEKYWAIPIFFEKKDEFS